MSADNWGKCPKCGDDENREYEKAEKELARAYGRVDSITYLTMAAELKAIPREYRESLREDYEIGIFDGEFSVEYCGCCDECGFEYKFKYTYRIVDSPK